MIGIQRMEHTYPGATVPFGIIQLSPDKNTIPFEINGNTILMFTNTLQATSMMTQPLLDSASATSAAPAILI